MAEIELNPDFRDLLHELSAAGAEFVLIGGWALAAHGYGRGTDDLDVLVRANEHNAARVFAALAAFGAPVSQHGVGAQLFASEGYGYRMGVKPNLVEILTVIDGVSFDEVWADRVEIELAGVSVPIMGRRSLLANKRASGRPKDLADVDWLERHESQIERERGRRR